MSIPKTPVVKMDLYNPDAHAEARQHAREAITGLSEILMGTVPTSLIGKSYINLGAEAVLSAFYELKYEEAYVAAAAPRSNFNSTQAG